jgi:hypothetical protein
VGTSAHRGSTFVRPKGRWIVNFPLCFGIVSVPGFISMFALSVGLSLMGFTPSIRFPLTSSAVMLSLIRGGRMR